MLDFTIFVQHFGLVRIQYYLSLGVGMVGQTRSSMLSFEYPYLFHLSEDARWILELDNFLAIAKTHHNPAVPVNNHIIDDCDQYLSYSEVIDFPPFANLIFSARPFYFILPYHTCYHDHYFPHRSRSTSVI